jgi:hypothetical protein
MSRASIRPLILTVILVAAPLHAAVAPSAKCAAAKQVAAIKKVAAKMKCFQKAAAKSVPVDVDCLAAAEEKFDAAVAKATKKGGCVRTGDGPAIEAAADRCLADIGNETPAVPPTCGTTAYPECGGSCPAGQQCQALISTRSADGSGGCDPVHECQTSCVCRSVATACDGQPCDQICKSQTTCAGQGQSTTTESCCSGDLGFCSGTSAAPVCCCSGSCFHLLNGGGTCQSGLGCNASGTASECQ